MPDDRSGPLEKIRVGGKESIIIFPCNTLNEKALDSRNKCFFLHFLALEISTFHIAAYR